MNKRIWFPKLAAALMALALTVLVSAAMAESVQAVVSVESMNVYAVQAPHALLGALPRGTEVEVTAKSGKAVKIRFNGYEGIARASELKKAQSDESETGRAMVANRDSRIYSKASTSSSYAGIEAGESVTLLAVNGQCAKVKRGGKVGYMVSSHLSEPGTLAPQETAAPAEPVTTVNAAAVTNQAARVYASAALSGDSVKVAKGVGVTLLAMRGDVAMVERGGAIGYMSLSALSKASASEAEAAPKAKNPFSSGSNEHVIYAFLTGEMGLNRAAAMGVMANIKYESGYNPNCNGDGGTSYGICQWHAGRKTNLIAYCEDQGLDYTALQAQMRFFKYELSRSYPSVLSYLKGVENTADGAYDAGYYFCFNYEAPAARTSQSTKRGNYAKDTLWAK